MFEDNEWDEKKKKEKKVQWWFRFISFVRAALIVHVGVDDQPPPQNYDPASRVCTASNFWVPYYGGP